MDWRDLLAWHQCRESLLTTTAGQALKLCVQDSARIYLSISLIPSGAPPAPLFLTTNANAGTGTAGLPIGMRWQASANNQFQGQMVAGTIGNAVAPAIPYSFTAAPGTGSFWNNATLISVSLTPNAGTPGTYETPDFFPQLAPFTYEFWPDRHGALSQLAWYVYDATGGSLFSVLTVTQDRNPCDYEPGSTTPRQQQRGKVCDGQTWLRQQRRTNGNQPVRRGRNLFRPPVGIQSS